MPATVSAPVSVRPLGDLMDAAAEADEEHQTLVVAAAEARADYEEARENAKLGSKAQSVAARNEEADSAAIKERRLWLIADARERAAKKHADILMGLVVAAQSRDKRHNQLDGGTDWQTF